MADTSITITDNRTGKTYQIPVENGAINAMALRGIKVDDTDFGLMSYDPGYKNTASTKSTITFIDGEKGILRYRGYPIDQLAKSASFLETAYLILFGELPNQKELEQWEYDINHHTIVHKNIEKFVSGFRYDAHPMGMFVSTLGALSTFYPEAKKVHDPENRALQIKRLISKTITVAAFIYRHSKGMHYIYPRNDLGYAANFLNMMFRMTEDQAMPDPVLVRAMDVLFTLHADHEQNCSTTAMRVIGSSEADPYVAAAGAAAALYGPLHGGANEQVLRMLREIGSVKAIPEYVKRVKSGEIRLMGFGHRVYKNYDPRAKIIKEIADQVFEVVGKNPLIDVAIELERIALEDDYFVSRKLYPNVDFYSGIIYQAMGLPVDIFPVLFAIGRMPGWLSQWQENVSDNEQKIARPRQLYLGSDERQFVPVAKRG